MTISSEPQTNPHPPRLPAPRPIPQMVTGCFVIPLLVTVAALAGFLYLRAHAPAHLIIPDQDILLVRAAPEPEAPLLARFSGGHQLDLIGRTEDWRWLEVKLWDGRRGWALRPLDRLVWQLAAPVTTPTPVEAAPAAGPLMVEEMVAIPAVTFTMGSPPGLGEEDERPIRVVTLSAFEIDRTEVTVGRYWQCVEAGTCVAPAKSASQTQPYYLNDPAFDNHPVINIPWAEAANYCRWQGKRLPTEAEWELAAGWDVAKGAKFQWPWGNEPPAGQVNVGETALNDTAVVGSFPADVSPVGVLDMAGNVSEWVFDWYQVDYYRVADNTDPTGPTRQRGERSGRIVRGGSFADPVSEARAASRRHQAEGYGYPTVGFRCARSK